MGQRRGSGCAVCAAKRPIDHHARGAGPAAVRVRRARVPIGDAGRSTRESAARTREAARAAALAGQRAAGAVRSAGGVAGRSLTAVRTRGHGHAPARESGAAVAIAHAELSIGAARRGLTDAEPLACPRAGARAAVCVGRAELALSTAPARGRTPANTAAEHLAVARATVTVATADLAVLSRARHVVVGDAHRQRDAVTDRVRVERALAGTAVGAGHADLALDAAALEQCASAGGARLSAALAVATAGLTGRFARRGWRSALAAHAEVRAAIGTHLARAARRLALGTLAADAPLAFGPLVHARERAALPGDAALQRGPLASHTSAGVGTGVASERARIAPGIRRCVDRRNVARARRCILRGGRIQDVEPRRRACARCRRESRESRAKKALHFPTIAP